MRGYIRVFGILFMAFLVLPMTVGCSKKGTSTSVGAGPGGQADSRTAVVLRDIEQKRAAVRSYVQVIGSGMDMSRMKVKLQDGKTIRYKMEDVSRGSWYLAQMDKQVGYSFDPSTGAAVMQRLDGKSGDLGAMMGMMSDMMTRPDIKTQLRNVDSRVMDGRDCWYFEGGDAGTSIWVDKQTGLTTQTENGAMVSEYKYEQINAVPDSEFELPAGTRVQSAPATPGQ